MLKIYKNLKPFILLLCGILVLQFLQVMANLYLPTLMADITNNGILKSDVPYIWTTGGWMLLISAGGVICAIFASFLSSKTAVGLGRILRNNFTNLTSSVLLH
jgi:ATP-binding cassette subfamily B protein